MLAVAEDGAAFSQEAYKRDLSNQHRVAYRYNDKELLQIPRNQLSEGLQRRLRVRGTSVADLFEFKDEIDKLFAHQAYSFSQEMQLLEHAEREKLKKGILENIRSGKTYLQTGGIGLENLVCELMCCEGYDAKILAKSMFTGNADADILALKEDSFFSKKTFVQVKHHKGFSGQKGIQQIIEVLKQEEYKEYEGYFVTSANIDDSTKNFASMNGIEVMDGEALGELLISNLNKLSMTTTRLLGISPYPHIHI